MNIELSFPLINIPSGEVQLRDDRIKKTWTAQIEAFQLAPIPVTKALYSSVMNQTADCPQDRNAPVTEVSWHDAISFCNKLSRQSGLGECYTLDGNVPEWNKEANGYRLPTEAEWQYACQAGMGGYRYDELDAVAWYSDNSGGGVHEAGQKKPNAWKLYDMLGNVWEWCWDVYDAEVYGSYRVFRGGSWAEEARGCGATCRRRSHPTFRIDDLGFRIARSL
ncbi:formylglycine-generating enzyme family protein [Paenibacillus zeisoli]|uniref:Formylglycine-generating enzyme family protein n=1 Tax=Paenibacillus zeisoli TaxID=2496267 RepID=A0A3S1DCD5_9BACL|nr:SUMF1/EgtB/PvdO family nonheme iron enzyme [Paenibacillus zeisoli]RUT35583.1 formylglycine-generating enzyme family protein [Paenibacillus zeisoli]